MNGWFGDFFRGCWALFYWNTRKTWFRLRGAHRDDCPCQSYSDSGHALDSHCEAVQHWRQPARFRRVCPLLTETAQGWRCGVDAESVRPFWGRAALQVLAIGVVLYLVGSGLVYGFLRAARYETSYLAVAWPPRWGELRASQEKLYALRAQQALQGGHFQEALLSLEMVTQLNPGNYAAGLAQAELNQVAGRPNVTDHIYGRLMHDVPGQRLQTARIWYRNLLARAAYAQIKDLAPVMLDEDQAERTAWLHALLFACRQTADPGYLGSVLAQHPHLPAWCGDVLGVEQFLLQKKLDQALPWLTRLQRQLVAGYIPYFQIDRLLRHGEVEQADNLLRLYRGGQLQPDEAAFFRLRVYHAKGLNKLAGPEFLGLLHYEMGPRLAAQCCAYLVSHPDPVLFSRYLERFNEASLPVDANTVQVYQATYLAAILSGDASHAEQLATRIGQFTGSDSRVLRGLGELLRGRTPDSRLPRILPLVALPTEVTYAILELPVAPRPAN